MLIPQSRITEITEQAKAMGRFFEIDPLIDRPKVINNTILYLQLSLQNKQEENKAKLKDFYLFEKDKMFISNYNDNIKGTYDEFIALAWMETLIYAQIFQYSLPAIASNYKKETERMERYDRKERTGEMYILSVIRTLLGAYYQSSKETYIGETLAEIERISDVWGVNLPAILDLRFKYNKQLPQIKP